MYIVFKTLLHSLFSEKNTIQKLYRFPLLLTAIYIQIIFYNYIIMEQYYSRKRSDDCLLLL